MARRPLNTPLKRLAGMLLVGVVVSLIGCATPQARYRVLNYFFDGVPNPDVKVDATHQDAAAADVPVVAVVRVHSQHKPYVERKCDECHRSAGGQIQDFSEAYNACVKCHKTVSTAHRLMHGPVVREACKYCHEPHEANQPHLLRDDPVKLCTQCHDQKLLGNYPPQHSDGKTDCLTCHVGHGGETANFLTADGLKIQAERPDAGGQPREMGAAPGKEPAP